MDAADLLLAALDEVGIANELGETLDDKKPPASSVTPTVTNKPVPAQSQQKTQSGLLDTGQSVKSEPRPSLSANPIIKPVNADTSVKNDIQLLAHPISKSAHALHFARDKNLNTLPSLRAQQPVKNVTVNQSNKQPVVQMAKPPPGTVVKKEPVLLRKMSTSMKQEIRSSAVVRQVPNVELKKEVKNEPIVPDDFGGSTDIDMFSQALMQLDQTNVQAAQFEAKVKKEPRKIPSDKDKMLPLEKTKLQQIPSAHNTVLDDVNIRKLDGSSLNQPCSTSNILNEAFAAAMGSGPPVNDVRSSVAFDGLSNIQSTNSILPVNNSNSMKFVTNSQIGAFTNLKPVGNTFLSQSSVSSHPSNINVNVPNAKAVSAAPISNAKTVLSSVTNPQLRQVVMQAISQNAKSGNQGKPVTIKIVQPTGAKSSTVAATRSGSPITVVKPSTTLPVTTQSKTVKLIQTADGRTIQIVQAPVPKPTVTAAVSVNPQSPKIILARNSPVQRSASPLSKTVILDSSVAGTKQVVLGPNILPTRTLGLSPSPVTIRQGGLGVSPSQMTIRPSGFVNQSPISSFQPSFVASPSRFIRPEPLPSVAPILSVPQLPLEQDKLDKGVVKTKLTSKDVSRLWANDDLKLKNIQSFMSTSSPATSGPTEAEAEEEEEELGHAETYSEYMPSKLKVGQRHPDPVVETSSLSSVEPSDVWYNLSIPETVIDYCHLSALQLEAITYACQKHETYLPSGERAGFLIGDGAGVGKGRTIAGVIYENYLLGRKRALWLSVSNDLKVDAERDLGDIGAGKIEVYSLNKFKYAKISSKINGKVKKGVIFSTYSSLIGESTSDSKYKTRLKQLLHWMGKDYDGLIVFDECHKAKNLCPVGSSKPTKTGLTVLELQRNLPKARVIYASATGASEPKNMAYMTRLGLWGPGTPFREFQDFIQAIEKRGVGAMELVAMDMKLRGMYIARQLSFKGVSFKIEEVKVPQDFYHIYNTAVKVWVDARDKFQKASDLMQAEHRMKKTMWGQFWSAHQRFFKYLCISSKVKHCVKMAREAVKNGKCVVIGLQSTGEARTLEQLEESGGELNDFVSTAKGVFQTLVEKHFPAPDRRKTYDIFGIGSSWFNDSPRSSPTPSQAKKRKKETSWWNSDTPKKAKKSISDSGSSSSSDSETNVESEPSLSESEHSDSDNDDFNPFGSGSDSDEDPWLKKSKKQKKAKPSSQKKKKVKKPKKKKKTKKSKKKDNSSDDEFADIDNQIDKALENAGLKSRDNSNSGKPNQSIFPGMDAVDQACAMKQALLDQIEEFAGCLPPNTLDELIEKLGGPENVAEMTGRKGRVVSTEDGSVQYESRSENDTPLEYLNLTEKQRFMDGEKNIAIISEAASSGISLQADRRAVNQRRRVHITLELPWSADRAIQQFGRTHRSNQVSAPEYLFLISELAGERRFASTVAKRLESLGALTHGDRRATETRDLSRFNIDNKYGRAALEAVMKSVLAIERPVVPLPKEYSGNFLTDVKKGLIGVGMISQDNPMCMPVLEKDYNNISKFLNRILGMEVELQNHLFRYFTETLSAIILEAKRNGRWDMGILDLGSGEESVRKLKTDSFVGTFSGSSAKVELHTICVERGTSWFKAINMWREHTGQEDGFYLSSQILRNGKRLAILVVALPRKKAKERLYQIHRPNRGLQLQAETMPEIRKKYKKVLPDDAQPHWEDQYVLSATQCTHKYNKGTCRKADVGLLCEIGLRSRNYFVLGGSVLSVWNKVEAVLASVPGGLHSKMQIIRLRTEDGDRIVGTLIPASAVDALTVMLKGESKKTFSNHHANFVPEDSMPLLF